MHARKAAQTGQDPLRDIEDSAVIGRSELKAAIASMPKEMWQEVRDSYERTFLEVGSANPQTQYTKQAISDDLKITELVLRQGLTERQFSAQRAEFGIASKSDAKSRIYLLINRILSNPALLSQIMQKPDSRSQMPRLEDESAVAEMIADANQLIRSAGGTVPEPMGAKSRVKKPETAAPMTESQESRKLQDLLRRYGSVQKMHALLSPAEIGELGYDLEVMQPKEGSMHGLSYKLKPLKKA